MGGHEAAYPAPALPLEAESMAPSLPYPPAPSWLSPHGATSQPWLGWAESRLHSGKAHASCQATDVNVQKSRGLGPRLCSFCIENADPPPNVRH